MRSLRFAACCTGLLVSLIASGGSNAQVVRGQEIVTLSGRDNIFELMLSTQIATSITFPAEITLVTGYGLVVDSAHAQELIASESIASTALKDLGSQPVTIVHYAEASRDTLALRAVRKGTPCYLTVRCGTRIFLFKLSVGEKANVAVIISDKGPGNEGVVELKKPDIVKARTNFSSPELIGILSRAKGRGFLETVNPDLYEGWNERRGVRLTSEDDKLTATITEIQQWPQKDALVFLCALTNKTSKEIHFVPGDVRVRAGDAAFNVQLADSSGIVAPGRSTLLDLVVQGNATGGKEHLSIQNDFRIEVPIADAPPPREEMAPNPLLPALDHPGGFPLDLPRTLPADHSKEPVLPNFNRGN